MWSHQSRRLADCLSIADLRALAQRRLPRALFDYLDGGAEDEVTLRRNRKAFDEHALLPSCLVDVTKVTTATRLLGRNLEWPVLCAPTGASRLYHPEGELAAARACARAGAYYALSTMATCSIEALGAATQGPKMFQLYLFKDRGITRELIARCKSAGFDALCLTVDAPARGKRERELRSGMGVPLRLNWASLTSICAHPVRLLAQVAKGPLMMPNFSSYSGSDGLIANTRFIGSQLDSSVTWRDLESLIGDWQGPFAVKGVMRAEDARRARECGATAVIVSNHGGRQLDGAAAPIEALPAIAAAVGDSMEVVLDGGIRRGSDILKALALGARACSIGRPYLYGLAAAGEAGVEHALRTLREELVLSMKLCGRTQIESVRSDLLLNGPAPIAACSSNQRASR
jgi:L-lactate dehydrogenase (cytochrome)